VASYTGAYGNAEKALKARFWANRAGGIWAAGLKTGQSGAAGPLGRGKNPGRWAGGRGKFHPIIESEIGGKGKIIPYS